MRVCVCVCVCVCVYSIPRPYFSIKKLMFDTNDICVSIIPMYVFTNLSTRAGCDTRSVFKRSLPNYLPIDGGKLIGFIPFPTVLVLC